VTEKWLFRFYLGALVCAPLFLGSRGTAALGLLEAACFSLLLWHRVNLSKKEGEYYTAPGVGFLAAVIGFMAFQLIPLPGGLVRTVAPGIYSIYEKTLGVSGPVGFMPLSLDVKAGMQELLRVASYAAFYVLTIQLLSDGRKFRKTVAVLSVLGGSTAAYALAEKFFSNGRIYWIFSLPPGNNHVGPFVYKNHYAGFIEMLFPVVFAAFLYYKPRYGFGGLKETVVELFTQKHADAHILLGFSALLMGTSQFISLSRGGIVCLGVSMVLFIVLFNILVPGKTGGKKNSFLVLFLFMMVVAVGWFGWEPVFQRFEDSMDQGVTSFNSRAVYWADSLRIIGDFLWTGTGAGSFGSIYPAYRTYPGSLTVDHAHSDAVELAVTLGIAGFILVAFFIASVCRSTFKAFVKRKDSYAVYMVLGGFSGCAAIGFHSFTDFNFFSNSNGLYMFFMAGFTVSAAHTRFRGKGESLLPVARKAWPGAIAAVTPLLLAVCLLFNGGCIYAEAVFSSVENLSVDGRMNPGELEPVAEKLKTAVLSDPLNVKYRLALATVYDYMGLPGKAGESFRKAVGLGPSQGEVAQRYGRFCLSQGEKEKGGRLMAAGLEMGRSDMERYRHCASFLLHSGETEQGFSVIREALTLDPGEENVRIFIAIMTDSRIEPGRFEEAMPGTIRPRLVLSGLIRKAGNEMMAERIEDNIITMIRGHVPVEEWMIRSLAGNKLKQGKEDEALDLFRFGLDLFPGSAELLIQAARLFEKRGLHYKALELYKKAYAIDPSDPRLKNKPELLSEGL
jgi:O-antigen ligase/tetratricopeptide (TPR) repeat protein